MILSKTIVKKIVFACLPPSVKVRFRRNVEKKKIQRQREIFKTIVSEAEIDSLFKDLAIDADIMIHSSLNDLGRIEGNMKHIAKNLQHSVIDKGHTVLCPAMAIKGSSLDYLKANSIFDVCTAGNAMGTVSRYYDSLSDSLRSLSPTHSVVAYGKGAEYYTSRHHLDETPFTENSPYFKLIINKGKVLMLGAQLKSLTVCHVVEDLMGKDYPINVYSRNSFPIVLKDKLGEEFRGSFKAHNKFGGILRDGVKFTSSFVDLPSTKRIPVGCGNVYLLDARDITVNQLEMLKKGITPYGKLWVSKACIEKANKWITTLSSL